MNRTAESAAILVALQDVPFHAPCIVEITIGVVSVVAVEFEGAAVEVVGAGLGHYCDYAAGATAIFSLKVAGDDLEFLDGVRIWVVNNSIAEKVVVQAAIQNESG